MTSHAPSFERSTPFSTELKARVADYFTSRGLSDKGNFGNLLRTLFMAALVLVPYTLLLTQPLSSLAALGLCVVIGVGFAGIGFCVGHDALHGSYSKRRWVNHLFGLSHEFLGGNRYIWWLTHNRVHHTYTNVCEVDEDLVVVRPVFRVTPTDPRYWFHRFQQYYAWFLYMIATLNWVFVKDFKYLAAKRIGQYEPPPFPRREVWRLFAYKGLHLAWTLAIPLLLIERPWWQIVVGYVAMNMTAGLILGVVFQLAHVVDAVQMVNPSEEGTLSTDYLTHQMNTTANFAPTNRLLTWYVGGLNHQVEHHLFPTVCNVHYEALAPIVREVAAKHGVPYRSHDTFFGALASHYRHLRELGRAPKSTPSQTPTSAALPV